MTCGFDDALSLMVTVPDVAPFDFGEKVTLMVQLAPEAMPLPQVEVMPNCPATFIEEIFISDLPLLVIVTSFGGLVVRRSGNGRNAMHHGRLSAFTDQHARPE
jgi:hypothetical protein